MPEVFVESRLVFKGREVSTDLILNSGARDAELLLPEKLAKDLELQTAEKASVVFGGTEVEGKVGKIKVILRNPKTSEERESVLEAIAVPDEVLDRPLLGVVGQEKLRVIPRTTTGEPIFE